MTEPITAVTASRSALVEMPRHGPWTATITPLPSTAAPSSGLREAAATITRMGDRLFAGNTNDAQALLHGVKDAALTRISPTDYVQATLVATDLSMQVSVNMMKFHVSTSLGSAATGLFNTLLKNRE